MSVIPLKPFNLSKNTDSVDIDAKCLGISAWDEGDLNNNRGLQIQIRHNRDKATFHRAAQLSCLIVAAPEMLDRLKACEQRLRNDDSGSGMGLWAFVKETIAKAEGRP